MSSPYEDPKKRPPAVNIPPLPLPRPVQAANIPQMNCDGQQQRSARNASNSTQHGPRNMGSIPLTSPLEQDTARLPPSQSQTIKSHASAKSTLTNIADQAHASPRLSDHSSTMGSQRGATTRSRHSERSYHSAAAAQAQLEALDERTTRGRMEERNEHKLFKMTGQVPPTPITGTANEDDVYIRTEDLRAQCRAVSEEKQAARDEPAKSPKKKMFGNMQIFKSFSRTPSTTPIPPMPSKAAQVLGTTARKPHIIEVRPIKPARPFKTPTKITPSDTSKSLPGKITDPYNYARRHHSGSSRRMRTSGRRSPGSKQSSDAENTPPVPGVNASSESVLPPTPPAKDTPPKFGPAARGPSPLRRAAQYDHLREIYEASRDGAKELQFPEFALSPSPPSNAIPEHGGASPTKFRPYTAEDYTRLIGGEPLQWPYPEGDDSSGQHDSKQLTVGEIEALPSPRPGGLSDQQTLLPRFYSPSNRSYCSFAEGESASRNTDVNRYLFSVPTHAHLLRRREDSNDGSIHMIYQGDAKDIDPRSSTGQLFKNPAQNMVSPPVRDDSRLATRVMQELHIGDHHEPDPQKSGASGHLQPDQSSSRLTDMLEGVSPRRAEFNGSFQPKCPSAVPSPLHKMPGALTPSQPQSILASPGSFGPWGPPHTPKNIDDHFFMTNEHLDVVGKTTWDLLQMFNQQHLTALNTKHEQLVGLVEKHIDEVKLQINTGHDKVEQASMQNADIHTKLDSLVEFIKQDVAKALAEHNKKATDTEAQLKELQKMVQALQKSVEQKSSEPTGASQQHSATGPPTSNSAHAQLPLSAHRSQPSAAGYYGNMADLGRDGQPAMAQMHDNRSVVPPQDGLNDARAGYNNNYGQQWGARTGYLGRNSKESDRLPYSGTNPYQFANGGQFNNSYAAGYSGYNFSPSPPDQHYAFNQGPAK